MPERLVIYADGAVPLGVIAGVVAGVYEHLGLAGVVELLGPTGSQFIAQRPQSRQDRREDTAT